MSTPKEKPEELQAETAAHPPASAGNAADALTPGIRVPYFGDYELLEEIGRGRVAVVYKARQVSLDRIVALKMIPPGGPAHDQAVKESRAAAEAVAGLDHPGLVRVFEVGELEGWHFTAMTYVEGESLGKRLERGPLPDREAALLVRQLAEAVHYCHHKGIVHRALQPANVLLDRAGVPKLTGFGLARHLDRDAAPVDPAALAAAPGYLAPELAEGKPDRGVRTDVCGLGAILYALVTGRPPFPAAPSAKTPRRGRERKPVGPSVLNRKQVRQALVVPRRELKLVAPSELNPAIHRDLETVCLRCLSRDSAWRYKSAADVMGEMLRWLSGRPIKARPVGRWRRMRLWMRRNPQAALWTGVVLLLVIGTEAWRWVRISAARQETWAVLYRPDAAPEQYQRALRYFDRAYTLCPNDPDILLHRGLAQYRTGDDAHALQTLSRLMSAERLGDERKLETSIPSFARLFGRAGKVWRMAALRSSDLEQIDHAREYLNSNMDLERIESAYEYDKSKRDQEPVRLKWDASLSKWVLEIWDRPLDKWVREDRVEKWDQPLNRWPLESRWLTSAGPLQEEANARLTSVPMLVRPLADSKPQNRFLAVRVLGALGPRAASAVAALVERTADDDEKVRSEATWALVRIDPNWPRSEAARQAVPALIGRLSDPNNDVVSAAIDTLGKIGPGAAPAISHLIVRLPGSEKVADVLAAIDPAWPRAEAARQAVPGLVQRLAKEKDLVNRAKVLDVLGRIGPLAVSALPALEKEWRTDAGAKGDAANWQYSRCWLAGALIRIDSDPPKSEATKEAFAFLIRELEQGPNSWRTYDPTRELAKLGPRAASAIPNLVNQIKQSPGVAFGEDPSTELALVEALVAIGPAAPEALPAYDHLINRWLSRHLRPEVALGDFWMHRTERMALQARCRLDPKWLQTEEGKKVFKALMVWGDPRTTDRERVMDLAALGPAARPALLRVLLPPPSWPGHADWGKTAAAKALDDLDRNWRNSEEGQRVLAVWVERFAAAAVKPRFDGNSSSDYGYGLLFLDQVYPDWPRSAAARQVLPTLVKAWFADPGDVPRLEEALDRIDRDWPQSAEARKHVLAWVGRLDEGKPDWDKRLRRIRPALFAAAPDALPELIEQTRHPDPSVRAAAIRTLGHIGPEATPAARALAERLYVPTDGWLADSALARLGPGARAVLPDRILRYVDQGYSGFDIKGDPDCLHSKPDWSRSEGARQAIPGLLERLSSPTNRVREAAAYTLTRIDPWWWYKQWLFSPLGWLIGLACLAVLGLWIRGKVRARKEQPLL